MRDVIVIGAGGGGPVVAKELAARGLDVLMLEAGARNQNPEKEWSRLEWDSSNPIDGYLRFGPSDRKQPAWQRELPQNSLILQIAGVGGTTLHYFGNCPRAYPGVFRGYRGADRNEYDRTYEVPLSYKGLIPYYEWVEHTLPVATSPIGTKERVFLSAAEKMGLPLQRGKDTVRASYRPQENAILQPKGTAGRSHDPAKVRYPQAQGCTFCGHCAQGCVLPRGAPRNLKAKRSTDNSYVPMALTADAWKKGGKAATLITDAFATAVLTEGSGESMRARAVRWRNTRTGEEHTEEAKVVVMAAGSVETPRLWLNSGLPNPNDWVGRGLTTHLIEEVMGHMPRSVGASKGPGSGARVDYPGRGLLEATQIGPMGKVVFKTLSDSGMAGLYDNGSPTPAMGADTLGRLVGPELMKAMNTGGDSLMSIGVIIDDHVERHNRVTLSSFLPADEHGPVPRVEMHPRRMSKRTLANRDFMSGKAAELLKIAGATSVHRTNMPPLILHVHSTMRMGAREADSVLDTNAESRGVKGLFIADTSSLANGLGGVNPTLTCQAIGTRTAEKIFQNYFGGSPWVRAEAPVVSTDPAVTKAVVARGV